MKFAHKGRDLVVVSAAAEGGAPGAPLREELRVSLEAAAPGALRGNWRPQRVALCGDVAAVAGTKCGSLFLFDLAAPGRPPREVTVAEAGANGRARRDGAGVLALAAWRGDADTPPMVLATTSVGELVMEPLAMEPTGASADLGDATACVSGKHAYPFFLSVSQEAGIAATASQSDSRVTLWDLRGGRLRKIKQVTVGPKYNRLNKHELMGVALSADGRTLAVMASNCSGDDVLTLHFSK